MAGEAQALKRIPRIKFPKRHSGPSGSGKEPSEGGSPNLSSFFSGAKATTASVGGKASLQPKRTPVSSNEIEAILLGGCI